MNCLVCSAATLDFGHLQVLGRYRADYRRCPACGMVFVADPYWLAEAYAGPLTQSDVGGVDRNLQFSKQLRAVIEGIFNHKGQFVDYGGGTGLLTRIMRDAGYNFFWYDRHCPNLYAEGFAADLSGATHYELLTAVEVFEHLIDPLETIGEMLAVADNLLIVTHLVADSPPAPGEWWYYSPEHGQHIAFFGRKTMEVIADKYRLHYVTNGQNLHLFSLHPVSFPKFKLLTWPPIAAFFGVLQRRPSLLPGDFAARRGNPERIKYTPEAKR